MYQQYDMWTLIFGMTYKFSVNSQVFETVYNVHYRVCTVCYGSKFSGKVKSISTIPNFSNFFPKIQSGTVPIL